MAGNKKLTDKERAWAYAYLETFNKTEAARIAKYAGNEASFRRIGYENSTKVHIREFIEAELAARALSANEVLARLSAHATADLSPYMTSNYFGKITLDLEAVKTAGLGHLIKKVTNTKDGSSVEFHDAQAALVHLGRYHKLFTDKVQVDDWRTQAIGDIKAGRIAYEALAEAFDDDLATELFRSAGVPIERSAV